MIITIDKMQNLNKFLLKIIIFSFFTINSLSQKREIKEGIFYLEYCPTEKINLCATNIFKKSKLPNLLKLNYADFQQSYDTIYKFSVFEGKEYDSLSTILFFDNIRHIKCDTLKLRCPKKYKRKMNTFLSKSGYRQIFDGDFSYLFFKIKFEVEFKGDEYAILPNFFFDNGNDFFFERKCKKFDVIRIISIEKNEKMDEIMKNKYLKIKRNRSCPR